MTHNSPLLMIEAPSTLSRISDISSGYKLSADTDTDTDFDVDTDADIDEAPPGISPTIIYLTYPYSYAKHIPCTITTSSTTGYIRVPT